MVAHRPDAIRGVANSGELNVGEGGELLIGESRGASRGASNVGETGMGGDMGRPTLKTGGEYSACWRDGDALLPPPNIRKRPFFTGGTGRGFGLEVGRGEDISF